MRIHGFGIKNRRSFFIDAVKASENALQELRQEAFNSKTLETLFYDRRYRAVEPNTCLVQSSATHEPVKLYISKHKDCCKYEQKQRDIYRINIFEIDDSFCLNKAGYKKFSILNYNNKKAMEFGQMNSFSEKYKGIGIREDEIQIKEALDNDIKSVERESFVSAILYHLKMGFTPVQKLFRVRSKKGIDELLSKLKSRSPEIPMENYTPIIVQKKGVFGTKYYFDENTTQAVGALRTVKEKMTGNIRPEKMQDSQLIDLELSGENLEKWRKMLAGIPIK